MKRLAILLFIATAPLAMALTTVTGTITGPDGAPVSGTATIALTAACAAPGESAPTYPVPTRVTIGANGVLSVALKRNDTCDPSGTRYKVDFQLQNAARTIRYMQTSYWNITSDGTVNIADVETFTTPAIPTSLAFSDLTDGTNNTAAMLVGAGASLGAVSTGTITATGLADADYGDFRCTSGICTVEVGAGVMVYPGSGIANSTGSAWGASYQVGTSPDNLVQLNGSAELPAVSAANLTNFPTLNQNTTGTSGGLLAQYIDWNTSSGGTSIANKPTLGALAAAAYPGAGVPNSTGSAWGTSYTVGTSADNLVQLNASGELPAVSAANLTNFPTLNQNTSGNAATATALASDPSDCSANQFANAIATSGNLTCAAIGDADVPDTITVSNYLPLAGGTLTGQLVADNLGIEFEESDTNPTCASGNFNIYADLSEGIFKKCQDGTVTDMDTGGGGGIGSLVEDASPQLGGDLDLNSHVITGMVIGTNIQAYSAELGNAYTAVSFSATPTFTAGKQVNNFSITLTGDVTSSTLASAAAGEVLNFNICQDGTGGHTFAWPTGFAAWAVPGEASACLDAAFFWDGSAARLVGAAANGGVVPLAESAAPGTPASGFMVGWYDSTEHSNQYKNSSGDIFSGIQRQSSTIIPNWNVTGNCGGTNGGALTVTGGAIVCSDDDGGGTSPVQSYGASFTNGGLLLTTASSIPVTIPNACTITAWGFTVDAGTATVEVWKVADGSAGPTGSDSINTSGVSISSGTHIRSTTLTDFTTTSVAANDTIAIDLTAVSGVRKLNFFFQCQ